LIKQLNVMQTTHHQQPPDHILSFKQPAHHIQHVDITRKSNAAFECEVYVTVLFWQNRKRW